MKSYLLIFSMITAASADDCIDVESDVKINLKKVCVGDEVISLKTKQKAKILEIDKSGLQYDKDGQTFIQIQDQKGHKIRMTDDDIIVNNKTLCAESNDKSSLCVGNSFTSLYDGSEQEVIGFTIPTKKNNYLQIATKNKSNGNIETNPAWVSFGSLKATTTGMVSGVASCSEGLLPAFESSLKKCAKKELVKKMEQGCNKFRNGNGKISLDVNSKDIKTECRKEYSMFGTSTTYCVADVTAKCEKIADLKDATKATVEGISSVSASDKNQGSEISNTSRGSSKDAQMTDEGSVKGTSPTTHK